MRVERGLAEPSSDSSPRPEGTVASIGNFDGVHRGHRAILDRVVAQARRLGTQPAVVTFEPHPRCILDPPRCPEVITPLEEKAELLAQAGMARLLVLEFTLEMSRWSADEFCERLHAALNLRALVVGEGFALGHRRQGDIAFLRRWGAAHAVPITVVEPLGSGGRRWPRPPQRGGSPPGLAISSSRIRAALAGGKLDEATWLLGRPYSFDAAVEGTDAAAASGGAITARLRVPPTRALPTPGRYAAWLRLGESWHMAVAAIGRRAGSGEPVGVIARVVDGAGEELRGTVRCEPVQRLKQRGTGASAPDGPEGLEEEMAVAVRRLLAPCTLQHAPGPPT